VLDKLRVDAALPHAARDELRVLAAEVDDEDGALLGGGLGHREPKDVSHQIPGR
jgi:hypothetical protein